MTERPKDRRESPRRGTEFSARFRVISGETGRTTKEVPAVVKNLSISGFCLATDFTVVEELHVLSSSSGVTGNSLEFTISVPERRDLKMLGTARWYDLTDEDDSYRYNVGVHITEIPSADLAILKIFLKEERKKRWKSIGKDWLSRFRRRSEGSQR